MKTINILLIATFYLTFMTIWREEEHPRDEDGKYTDKGGEKKSSVERIRHIIEKRKQEKKVALNQNEGYNNVKIDNVA